MEFSKNKFLVKNTYWVYMLQTISLENEEENHCTMSNELCNSRHSVPLVSWTWAPNCHIVLLRGNPSTTFQISVLTFVTFL